MTRRTLKIGTLVLLALWGLTSGWRALSPSPGGWSLAAPATDAAPVNSPTALRSIYPVGSWRRDWTALGGFGPCDNYPFPLESRDWGQPGTVSLIAFDTEPVAYGKHQGFAVRIVNGTLTTKSYPATDSLLSIVQEAQDEEGNWRPIEAEFEPYCGNSFHRVKLGTGEFWQVPARRYAGDFRTKLRLRWKQANGNAIYSNEFDGQINVEQFAVAENGRPMEVR